jgi:hypothetical protein
VCAVSLFLFCTACQPSLGPFVLEAAAGRVVDDDTGAPIADAEVIEWHRGAGSGGSQPTYHARWATTDASGGFSFSREVAPSVRMWLLRTYDATYSFYHPDYGLEHAGSMPEEGSLVLRGSRARAAMRRANLDPICRGEADDPGSRHLAAVACPSRPSRPASESAR